MPSWQDGFVILFHSHGVYDVNPDDGDDRVYWVHARVDACGAHFGAFHLCERDRGGLHRGHADDCVSGVCGDAGGCVFP